MALPIAQLGYIPSMGAPSHGTSVIPKEQSPWKKLAESALASIVGSVASNGVANAMSRDYATQNSVDSGTGSGGVSVGPITNSDSGESYGGEKTYDNSVTPVGPQNASFLSKVLQGPQMNGKQYEKASSDRDQAVQNAMQRNMQQQIAAAAQTGDTTRTGMNNDVTRRGQDIAQSDSTAQIAQRYAEMMSQADTADKNRAASMQGSVPANIEAQAAQTRAANPMGPQSAAESASVNVFKAYVDYVQEYAKMAIANKASDDYARSKGQPVPPRPPLMTQPQFFQMYNSGRPTFGLPQFPGAGQ